MTPDAPAEPTAVRIETCEKHGLRYNAAVAEGCARCRTEQGERATGVTGFAHQRTPELGRGLLIAAALVAVVGGGLFLAHTVAYRAGLALIDETLEHPKDGFESDFDELLGGEDDSGEPLP